MKKDFFAIMIILVFMFLLQGMVNDNIYSKTKDVLVVSGKTIQELQDQKELLEKQAVLLELYNALLEQYNIELERLGRQAEILKAEIIALDSLTLSQEADIIILTEAIMSFKEVWDTLELQRFTATAYSPFDNVSGIENDGDPNYTATGSYPGWGTFAVCPNTIPYYSDVTVIGEDYIEHGVALDTGATMRKHGTWIDLYRDTYLQTIQFGVQDVYVLWQNP